MTGWAKQTRSGFTIVELLIVVVVIAILAAITIVSYNGITTRSKESNAQSTLRSFAQKYDAEVLLKGSQLTDAEFSALYTQYAGLSTANQGIVYTNSVNSLNGLVTDFCAGVDATSNITRYFVNSSDQKTPRKGNCTGAAAGQYTLQ